MHGSTKAKEPDSYAHKHLALQWALLTDCGEGGAVMQRQGPETGHHAHSLGIIASNPYAHWFWQAQGWAITACCGQEWLCWTMTTRWLLLCTSDSHHTNNSQTQADNQGGSSYQTCWNVLLASLSAAWMSFPMMRSHVWQCALYSM